MTTIAHHSDSHVADRLATRLTLNKQAEDMGRKGLPDPILVDSIGTINLNLYGFKRKNIDTLITQLEPRSKVIFKTKYDTTIYRKTPKGWTEKVIDMSEEYPIVLVRVGCNELKEI